ncbi:MAG: PAS domain-containing protein [Alphaproteobacteria bacterium]|jgi:hypothetical protein|nr:PAS domain-containing protein [Alphaproteobacteria bacterium]
MTGRSPLCVIDGGLAPDGPAPDGPVEAAPTAPASLDRFVEITGAPVTGATASLKGPSTRALFDWWRGLADAAGRLPGRADFDILDHIRIAADLFLVEVRGPGVFRIKVQGDNVIAVIGQSNMGRDVRLTAPVGSKERGLAEHYAQVVETATAWHCRGSAAVFDKNYLRVESIDCPLADPATGAISHIVGVLQELPRGA